MRSQETIQRSDIKLLFEKSVPGRGTARLPQKPAKTALPEGFARGSRPRLPELSEVELARHYSALERRSFGVNNGFYPLGSCTMKYNPRLNEDAAGLPGFVDVHPLQFQSFDSPSPVGEQKGIDLVYNIPLQVTVELGKTKKEISEILAFSMGTIVVLDKIAGDPVEIVVNGKLIARGEVVVIDDSYGVRITDIING